jgi:Chitobiase/beta-hexosaminidase C-terminal domain
MFFALGLAGLALSCGAPIASGQANQWQWVAGFNGPPLTGPPVYGPKGVFDPSNTPAAQYYGQSGSWTDTNGNLWSLVGISLWQFNPTTKEWAWMGGGSGQNCPAVCGDYGVYGTKGVPQAGVYPGNRDGAASWTDSKGRFWLFGGLGYDFSTTQSVPLPLNDLWMLDPATGLWGWMGGDVLPTNAVYGTKGRPDSANIPGARSDALFWTGKDGNFWLYGGRGEDSSGTSKVTDLDDLWMFNPTTMEWTWVGGDSVGISLGAQPVYGTQGLPAAGNSPGYRTASATWTDQNGNLWLYSGFSYYTYNDIWEYNPSSNLWAWMGGEGTPDCYPNYTYICAVYPAYGPLGKLSSQSDPGPRGSSYTWIDQSGNFWLFGGGIGVIGTDNAYDDIWEFNPSVGQWAWMGGDSKQSCATVTPDCWEAAVYGTQGTPAAGNVPGSRSGGASWVDKDGSFWLFGGTVVEPALVQAGQLSLVAGYNDIWKFTPSTTTLPPAETPHLDPLPGEYPQPQSVTISSGMPNAAFHYTTDGTTPTSNSKLYSGPFLLTSSETVRAITTAPGYPDSGAGSASYALQALPPSLSLPGGTYSTVQTLTISDSTPGASIFYTTDGKTPTTSSTKYTGPLSLSTDESIIAIAAAPNFANSPTNGASYVIKVPQFTLSATQDSLSVNSGSQGSLTLTITPQNGFNSAVSFTCSGLPAGASCTFNPATVTPSGSAVTTQLTIAASASASNALPSRSPLLPATTLALAGGLLFWRRRRTLACWAAAVLLSAGLLTVSACGGGGGSSGGSNPPPPPPPTAATVTVTASSGALQQTTTIALTINH